VKRPAPWLLIDRHQFRTGIDGIRNAQTERVVEVAKKRMGWPATTSAADLGPGGERNADLTEVLADLQRLQVVVDAWARGRVASADDYAFVHVRRRLPLRSLTSADCPSFQACRRAAGVRRLKRSSHLGGM
jgi:hypothetical protein